MMAGQWQTYGLRLAFRLAFLFIHAHLVSGLLGLALALSKGGIGGVGGVVEGCLVTHCGIGRGVRWKAGGGELEKGVEGEGGVKETVCK